MKYSSFFLLGPPDFLVHYPLIFVLHNDDQRGLRCSTALQIFTGTRNNSINVARSEAWVVPELKLDLFFFSISASLTS